MSGMVFRFKEGTRLPGLDPQAIGEALEGVREASGAGFSARAVKEAARDTGSPLHPAVFDRAPAEAAEAYYESQAAYLIRHVVVVYEDADHVERQTNAFVSVKERVTEECRFLPVFVAMSDEDYRQQVVKQALDGLLQWRHKYAEVREFARVFAVINETAQELRTA